MQSKPLRTVENIHTGQSKQFQAISHLNPRSTQRILYNNHHLQDHRNQTPQRNLRPNRNQSTRNHPKPSTNFHKTLQFSLRKLATLLHQLALRIGRTLDLETPTVRFNRTVRGIIPVSWHPPASQHRSSTGKSQGSQRGTCER